MNMKTVFLTISCPLILLVMLLSQNAACMKQVWHVRTKDARFEVFDFVDSNKSIVVGENRYNDKGFIPPSRILRISMDRGNIEWSKDLAGKILTVNATDDDQHIISQILFEDGSTKWHLLDSNGKTVIESDLAILELLNSSTVLCAEAVQYEFSYLFGPAYRNAVLKSKKGREQKKISHNGLFLDVKKSGDSLLILARDSSSYACYVLKNDSCNTLSHVCNFEPRFERTPVTGFYFLNHSKLSIDNNICSFNKNPCTCVDVSYQNLDDINKGNLELVCYREGFLYLIDPQEKIVVVEFDPLFTKHVEMLRFMGRNRYIASQDFAFVKTRNGIAYLHFGKGTGKISLNIIEDVDLRQ